MSKKIILITIAFCIPAIFFVFNPAKFPADDGYFYPQIAYNIVHGNGMRFNDIYLTNGFHPLWMIFCIFFEIFNFFEKQEVLYILWLFQTLFTGLGFYYLLKYLFSENYFSGIIGISFLSLVFFSLGTLFLTEAHLSFLINILLLCFLVKNKRNDLFFGILCSLLFLARLDNLFIIIFLGIYYWKQKHFNLISALKIFIGFSILSLPYLFSNYYLFESIVPISGKIKSSFPYIQNGINFNYLEIVFLLSNLCYLFLLLFIDSQNKRIKIYYTLGSISLLVFNILFQSQIGQWYFVVQMIVTSLLFYCKSSAKSGLI